jgi:hypothetical protein
MDATTSAATNPHRRRPFGVTVVALVQLAAVLIGVGAWLTADRLPWHGPLTDLVRDVSWVRVAAVGYMVLAVLAAIGLWRVRTWGWILALVVVSLSLALDIVSWWRGVAEERDLPFYGRMCLDVVSAFYLNSSGVRRAFIGPPKEPSPAVVGTASAGRIDP